MKVDMTASQNALSLDIKQSQAVLRAGQYVNRAKAEAQQAPAANRSRYQDAYIQASKEAASAESSRLQQRSYAVKQLSAQMSRAVSQSTRDANSVIATLIALPIRGEQPLLVGRFLDKFA